MAVPAHKKLVDFTPGNVLLFLPCGAILMSLFYGYLFKGNNFPEPLFIPQLFLAVAFIALLGNYLLRLRPIKLLIDRIHLVSE